MELQALIFDCDGTLAETEEAHREAFNRVFAENGLDWHWSVETYGELLQTTGGKERMRRFIRQYNPDRAQYFIDNDHLVPKMHVRKTAIYMDLVKTGEVPLRPGIERLINEAREQGVRLAIATTTNIEPLTALFEGTLGKEALNWFDSVVAGDMVKNKKPASDVYDRVLQEMDLQGPQCLAIEDTTNGIVSARAANIPVLVTVSEYSAGQDFSGAIVAINNLDEPGQAAGGHQEDRELSRPVDLRQIKDWHAGWVGTG